MLSQYLSALRETTDARCFVPKAFRTLPPAVEEHYKSLKVTELKDIATRMALPNRTKDTRKADIINHDRKIAVAEMVHMMKVVMKEGAYGEILDNLTKLYGL